MKTIIQTIGPLYGDDANGTVFGQPNGSVYTPPANQLILISENVNANKIINDGNLVISATSVLSNAIRARFNVLCQVEWSAVHELATDSAFSAIVCSRRVSNPNPLDVAVFGFSSEFTVVNGTTYYGRIRIVDKNGGEVMATDTYTFTGAA